MGAQMYSATAFPASAVSREELNGIIAEHLAVEQIRVFRQLLMARFGIAILVLLGVGAGFAWLPALACIAILSAVLAWVWLAERRRQRHLSQRMQGIPGSRTHSIPSTAITIAGAQAKHPSQHG